MTALHSELDQSDIEFLLLNPEKQHALIDFLTRYSSADIVDLAHLLDVSTEKLRDVRARRDCLDGFESRKLIDCFWLWCVS